MRFILHLEQVGFYVSALQRVQPTSQPRVILREKQVLDACPIACGLGVRLGMPELEARTLAHGAEFLGWRHELFAQAQSQWLDLCVPFSDILEPLDQHIALLDLSAHPEPISLAYSLGRALRQAGIETHMRAASVRWIACTMPPPRLGPSWELEVQSAREDPAGFIANWPTEALTPALPEHRRRLVFLGYRTIGEVARVKPSVLKAQFGAEGARILHAARGQGHQEVRAIYPPDSAQVTFTFPGGTENGEDLSRGVARLGKQLGQRLEAKDAQGFSLEFTWENESGKCQTLRRKFHKPIAGPRGAMAALRLMLPEQLDEPIVRISAVLHGLVRAESRQAGLVGAQVSASGGLDSAVAAERRRHAEVAVEHLKQSLGETRIQAASSLVETRRQKVLRAWKEATGWH